MFFRSKKKNNFNFYRLHRNLIAFESLSNLVMKEAHYEDQNNLSGLLIDDQMSDNEHK